MRTPASRLPLPAAPLLAASLALTLAFGAGCPAGPPGSCKTSSECDGGFLCGDAGMCEAPPACPATACGANQVCVAARCQPTSCGTPACGTSQYCRNGKCEDVACATKFCAAGEACVKGACVLAQCDGTANCTEREYCSSQDCVARACLGTACSVTERCAPDGQCYPTGASGSGACGGACNSLESCVNGTCQETRCVGITCATGELCGGGLCNSITCGNITCPQGRMCGASGRCEEPMCATVVCQAGFTCQKGKCNPTPKDGGVPDAGPTPDAGPVDAGCFPPTCYAPEKDCANGFDDNADGKIDCLDPSCNLKSCNDHNPCTYNETCQFSQCRTGAADTLKCDQPPPGICLKVPGYCQPDRTCLYGLDVGASCGPSGQVCRSDGGCSVPPATTNFPFPVSNVDAGAVVRAMANIQVTGGVATFNSTDGGFGGVWATMHPNVAFVTTPTGPATVLAANSLEVMPSASIRVTGSRPVIFLMWDTIILHGPIDAAGHGTEPGAGGNQALCQVPVGTGSSATTPAGGAGATYGTVNTQGSGVSGSGGGGAGGPGGVGRAGGRGSTQGTTGAGGKAGAQSVRTGSQLIGGCNGGNGGNSAGYGGAGGGAVQLVAGTSITLDATWVDVSGAGGRGGDHSLSGDQSAGGAGGGGSAGTLILESPSVTGYYATLVANGGSGGEGAGRVSANNGAVLGIGANGMDGQTSVPTQRPPGGTNMTINGGNGGDGQAAAGPSTAGQDGVLWTDPTSTYADVEGGGGGGGGASANIIINIQPGGGCDLPKSTCQVSPGLTTTVANRCNQ